MPNYLYYYSSAVCLIWQGEPLICFSFSDLRYLWTSVLPCTFWNACQVLKKILEMWLALHWMCSLMLESYLWTWLSSHLSKNDFLIEFKIFSLMITVFTKSTWGEFESGLLSSNLRGAEWKEEKGAFGIDLISTLVLRSPSLSELGKLFTI